MLIGYYCKISISMALLKSTSTFCTSPWFFQLWGAQPFEDQPPRTKIWNEENFLIVIPNRRLQKQYLNHYLTDKSGLFQSYISHIYVPNVDYISPISHTYITIIKSIFQSFEFGEKKWIQDPAPHIRIVYILNCVIFIFNTDLPPLWNFSTFLDIFSFDGSPY